MKKPMANSKKKDGRLTILFLSYSSNKKASISGILV